MKHKFLYGQNNMVINGNILNDFVEQMHLRYDVSFIQTILNRKVGINYPIPVQLKPYYFFK